MDTFVRAQSVMAVLDTAIQEGEWKGKHSLPWITGSSPDDDEKYLIPNNNNNSEISNMITYIDLATNMPSEFSERIGHLAISFGRLEHVVLLSLKRIREISLQEAQNDYKKWSLYEKINGKKSCKKNFHLI
jgi:hypothetical protein